MTFTARLKVVVVSGVAVSDRIPSTGLRLPSSGGSGTGSGGTSITGSTCLSKHGLTQQWGLQRAHRWGSRTLREIKKIPGGRPVSWVLESLSTLGNPVMDPDTAPDSWELEEDTEAPSAAAELPTAFAALNVNAKPFVPNPNAPVFVPTFLQASPAEMPASGGRWSGWNLAQVVSMLANAAKLACAQPRQGFCSQQVDSFVFQRYNDAFIMQTGSKVTSETCRCWSHKSSWKFDDVSCLSKGPQDPVTYMEVTETVGMYTSCMFSFWLLSWLSDSLLPHHRCCLRLRCNMLLL